MYGNQYYQPPVTVRFWSKVNKTSTCWLWVGCQGGGRYGQFTIKKVRIAAHRFAYIEKHGTVPKGLELDHLCRVRLCVKPDHLEAVTRQVNLLRGEGWTAIHARKTQCINGHPFNLANTILRGPHRRCRTCKRKADTRRRERIRETSSTS